jgi:hypothetical protein
LAIFSQASGKLFSRGLPPPLDALKAKTSSLGGYLADALRPSDDRLTGYVGNVVSGAKAEERSRIDDGNDLCRSDGILLRVQLPTANCLRLA